MLVCIVKIDIDERLSFQHGSIWSVREQRRPQRTVFYDSKVM